MSALSTVLQPRQLEHWAIENDKALIQEVTKVATTVGVKRKRTRVRPEPRLFDPSKFLPGKVTRIEAHMFKYQRGTYSYGLRVKFFPETSLDPRLPSLSSNLKLMFIESQHPFVVIGDLPCLEYWSFEEGEVVMIGDIPGLVGAIVSVDREQQRCIVEFGKKGDDEELNTYAGLLSVPMRKLEKVVKIGDYVKIVAGVKKDIEGLVTEKGGTELHVFGIAPAPSELDEPSSAGNQKGRPFRVQKESDVVVHVNSVELSSPPFVLDHGPWFNVWVVVNTVKGVLTIKKKNEKIKYHGLEGQVKYVRRTGPNKLGVFVYIPVLDATTEFEPQDLLDKKPLPDQYRQFRIDPDLDKMYTGRPPWFGVRVRITAGHRKGLTGVVRDTQRVEDSGSCRVKVQIELDLFTAQGNNLEWVFIKDVLVLKTGQPIYAFWPVPKSSIFYPSQEDLVPLQRRLQQTVRPEVQSNVATVENEMLDPWDPWDPRQTVPLPDSVSSSTGSTATFGEPHTLRNRIFSQANPSLLDEDAEVPLSPRTIEDNHGNTFPHDNTHLWNRVTLPTAARVFTGDEYVSPPPTPPRLSPPPPSPPLPVASSAASTAQHWLIQVKFADLPKPTYIQTTKRPTGVIIPMRKKGGLWQDTSPSSVEKLPVRTFTNQTLMVIVDGNEEHIGKLVRGIYYFYNGSKAEEKKWWIVVTVNPKMTWMPAESPELLDVDPNNLALTEDTSEAKANAKTTFDIVRAAARTQPPEVRHAYDEDSATFYAP
ncbi:hypothetical protein MPER_13108 [Moniliophthora perniciosa FA553]|nr:hypothetical protein MPER_13108 [Moniliophthora perniciosa FA553]